MLVRHLWSFAAVAVLLLACAPAPSSPGNSGGAPPVAPKARTHIAIADLGIATVLNPDLGGSSTTGTIAELISAGLVDFDSAGNTSAQLAEATPTLDNSLWKLFPDGRMETTWTIRDGARWQDGTPLTTDDLLFTMTIARDVPEFGSGKNSGYSYIESAQAKDARTLVMTWKAPYIQADWMFSYRQSVPLPRHLLEASYLADKAQFPNLRYWTSEFVGNGPFVVRDFQPGATLTLTAWDDYVLGRPKIDDVEVRFIKDPNTVAANVMAGAVQLTIGPGLSIEQAQTMQANTPGAKVIYSSFFYTQTAAYPQFTDPNPAIQLNVQFRRALAYAVDRQELVDSVQAGLGAIAKSMTAPTDPDFKVVEPRIVEYPYDPGRAVQIIQELGYTRGSDGMFRGADNQPLAIEVRGGDRTGIAVADYWNRVGLRAEPANTPVASDKAATAAHPGFTIGALQTTLDRRWYASEAPVAENKFAGSNTARYMNKDFDALMDRYWLAVPRAERASILGDIVHWMTDQVLAIHLVYNISPQLINEHLKNVTPRTNLTQTWHAHLWDWQ
jgi:peptide/nickel transport system substrate-binding protein